MKNIKYIGVAALLLNAAVVFAAESDPVMDRPSFSASQSVTISAIVEAIDHDTRIVTVRKPDGDTLTFTASDDARNLDQVDVGDVLVAKYIESVSIEVLANDGMEAEMAEATAVARTKEGEMPGLAAMDAKVVTATVEEINVDNNTFKLKGPDGVVNEYVARNPENLKRAEVGDLVVITITEAVAITVEKSSADQP
jgi:Cu/Ag efflux protein CusF